MAVTADYACTAVERELVLRLASLIWRLRRATATESGLFKIHAQNLLQFRRRRQAHRTRQNIVETMYRDPSRPRKTFGRMKTKSQAVSTLTLDQPQSLLIDRTISHAPSSASRTCRPIPSTD
jgi:hypothetical protein